MTEPVRLLHITGEPAVDYRQFHLFDVESRRYSLLDLPSPDDDVIGVSGDGGARFFTLGDMTDVLVDVEVWTIEPSRPTQSFERQYDGEFTVETGRVVLGSTTGSPGDVLIELPLPGPFRIRAFRNSHATVNEDFPEMNHHDEQWLIQTWPTS